MRGGGRGGDGADLADALRAVGKLVVAALFNQFHINRRRFGGTPQPQFTVSKQRVAVLHRKIFGKGVAQPHHHATLDLPFAALGVDHVAHVVRGNHAGDALVFIHHHHVRGVAVRHMADRIGLGAAHGVGRRSKLRVVPLPFQRLQRAALLQGFHQLRRGAAGGLAGKQGLAAGRGGAGVGSTGRVGRIPNHLTRGQAGRLADHLHAYGAHPLPHAGRGGIHMRDSAAHLNGHAAHVRHAHAQPGVFHRPRDACVRAAFIGFLHGEQTLRVGGVLACDLPVGQDFTGADGV